MSEPMKRLYLHIGPHKTGTTSFQRSLEANAAELARRGLRPVTELQLRRGRRTGRQRAALYSAADLFLRPGLQTGARQLAHVPVLTDAQRANRRAGMARHVANMSDPAVLMSSESFWYLRTEEERVMIADFLRATGRNVTVIFANRPLAEWKHSWREHLAGWNRRFPGVPPSPDRENVDADWFYDVSAHRRFWAPFDIREVAFDAGDDIVPALYRAAGIESGGLVSGFRLNAGRS